MTLPGQQPEADHARRDGRRTLDGHGSQNAHGPLDGHGPQNAHGPLDGPAELDAQDGPGDLDLAERHALQRVSGLSTELQDVTEVEYRALRLERVILVGVWTEGTLADAQNSLRELSRLAETAGSVILDGLIQRRSRPMRPPTWAPGRPPRWRRWSPSWARTPSSATGS